MIPQTPTQRLAAVLRAENEALAIQDHEAAARLLPEKLAAVAALRASLPGAPPDPAVAGALRSLAAENERRLALAIEVQGRVLETVARAARAALPTAGYGARGNAARTAIAAMAVRA